MKALTLLFLLLLALEQMEGRRSPGEYWKHVMGDEPMPEAIADLLASNQEGNDAVFRGYSGDSAKMMGKENWDRWIKRDFETRSVAIIYHHHDGGDHHDHQVEHHGDDAS